jgi:hypothetical protein
MMYFGYKRNKRVVTMVVLREVDIKEVPEVDMDEVRDEDMEEGEVDPPLVLTMWRNWPCVKIFVPNHTLYGYCYNPRACYRGLS